MAEVGGIKIHDGGAKKKGISRFLPDDFRAVLGGRGEYRMLKP